MNDQLETTYRASEGSAVKGHSEGPRMSALGMSVRRLASLVADHTRRCSEYRPSAPHATTPGDLKD